MMISPKVMILSYLGALVRLSTAYPGTSILKSKHDVQIRCLPWAKSLQVGAVNWDAQNEIHSLSILGVFDQVEDGTFQKTFQSNEYPTLKYKCTTFIGCLPISCSKSQVI